MAELRDRTLAGDREIVIGEGVIAVPSDEEVLVSPTASVEASDVVVSNVMASESGHVATARIATERTEREFDGDGSTEDIDIYTISRLGGGAALGALVGTWIFPGAGSLAGAALGGALGTFAPNILLRVRLGVQRNGRGDTSA